MELMQYYIIAHPSQNNTVWDKEFSELDLFCRWIQMQRAMRVAGGVRVFTELGWLGKQSVDHSHA